MNSVQETIIGYVGAFAIVGALGGGIYTVREYIPNQVIANRIEQIDHSASHIFNMTSCVRETGSSQKCQDSWDSAVNNFWMRYNRLRYSSQSACLNNHPDCRYVKRYNGKFYEHHYYPTIIGWEALADDLDVSIPIYDSKYPSHGLRYDGKSLAYTPRP